MEFFLEFSFFRLGELLPESQTAFDSGTHLAWGDMAMDSRENPVVLKIHLKRSKTDQFGTGANIVLGRTGCELCPVAALLGYVVQRGTTPGPLFLNRSARHCSSWPSLRS